MLFLATRVYHVNYRSCGVVEIRQRFFSLSLFFFLFAKVIRTIPFLVFLLFLQRDPSSPLPTLTPSILSTYPFCDACRVLCPSLQRINASPWTSCLLKRARGFNGSHVDVYLSKKQQKILSLCLLGTETDFCTGTREGRHL